MNIREDAEKIISKALLSAMPDTAVKKALANLPEYRGKLVLVAIGKAAWQMAKAAYDQLGEKIDSGIVITKYDHSKGNIGNLVIREAGHPVPDENSYKGTQEALDMVDPLTADDLVLFLISGGGSALFEKPLVSPEELEAITDQLLSCGADITQINTIRKRLSAVKGGKFALHCQPAKVFSIVLSDIIGDPLDMIASGPAYPDSATSQQALDLARKFNLTFSQETFRLLEEETPKELKGVTTYVTGSVSQLCQQAKETSEELGYSSIILTDSMCCEAKEAGSFMASIAKYYQDTEKSIAFIGGGETVVKLTGNGLGGRNQELALTAAKGISGMNNTAIFSVGSDGTDGPTDAAGGYVDGNTASKLAKNDIDIDGVLKNNDAYHALEKVGGLIITGPTGTNVNDLTVLLIKR